MARPAHRAVFGVSAVAVAGLVYGLASCASSTTITLYTPFTGLRIDAASLFAGYTCGVDPGQIYAYAAVVTDVGVDSGIQPVGLPAANVYACGTNGEFQNLPGSGFYQVRIYAYDKASFPADLACAPDACAPPTAATDFGIPTWTTTCLGTQEAGDNALAVCSPLVAVGSFEANDAGPDATTGDQADATQSGDAGATTPLDGGISGADASNAEDRSIPADALDESALDAEDGAALPLDAAEESALDAEDGAAPPADAPNESAPDAEDRDAPTDASDDNGG